ncbi:DKNYY domain-containing protein [Pontibacter burrus]|uniref:DKNYY family protein n=1 Tax=Pontibacter burrus TaxID=2704466 RepID=A0A6B3M045_9BACT|nr:DKNYY domain-containing protein [Pontibacter burrus]NEM99164.1 hypothetical protein [Pontibacter burrus]
MTIGRLIILVLGISILTSCRHGYKVEDGKVYYEYWHEGLGFEQGKRLIEVADAKSFKPLSFDCDCSFEFGKDKNYLFINGEPIKNIDPNTFTFIGNYIFRDKNSAYFFGFYNNLNDCDIKGVDPDKITLIKYPWAKADNFLIHGSDTIRLDDINEFIPIDDNWGRTKKYIINKDKILYGADVETFKITSSFEGKDKNYNYEFGFIARDDFKKTKYKNFSFQKEDICNSGLLEFTDIYDNEEPIHDYQHEKSVLTENLKINGFTLNAFRHGNWSSGPRIVSYILTDNHCDCYVDKLYHYDYSKPSETEKNYRVTERIHCRPTAL